MNLSIALILGVVIAAVIAQDVTSTGGTTSGGNDGNNNTTGSSCADFSHDCSACIANMNCIWCKDVNACQDGHWYSPQGKCSDWRWKQCELNGKYVLIAAAGLVGVVLLSLLLCVCCCCCCQKRKKSKNHVKNFKEFKAIQMEEEKEGLLHEQPSKHPKTDSRRAQIMEKYKMRTSHHEDHHHV
eukprot:TRINITY_DN989_c0_g1_i1.p1 TRINITY_DN989_c0_g1~~TRINITY_DN989_c0_g1_i1.p1  ORF type:complete len:184 (+),score=36.58 TRINITY_DN989_c0_g1_i1:82-633(+)